MIQLGELSAPATWKADGEILSVQFATSALGRDQLRYIRDLKLNPHPISLSLEGKRSTEGNHIIGFEEKPGTVTFHIARHAD